MAIRAEEFRGGDGLRPNTKLLLGTLVSQLVKAFEQAVREGEWGCAVLVGSVGQKAAGSARPRFRLGPLWGFCAVLGWDRCCWFIAAGLAVLHSCTLSAALHRGGWGGGTTTSGCAVLSAHRAPHSAPLAAQRCSVGVSPPPAPVLSP